MLRNRTSHLLHLTLALLLLLQSVMPTVMASRASASDEPGAWQGLIAICTGDGLQYVDLSKEGSDKQPQPNKMPHKPGCALCVLASMSAHTGPMATEIAVVLPSLFILTAYSAPAQSGIVARHPHTLPPRGPPSFA